MTPNIGLLVNDGYAYQINIAEQYIRGSVVYIQDNFSYNIIDYNILIPEGQQMVVFGEILIENELQIEGQLILEH